MESWRSTFRRGYLPGISTTALYALRDALAADDPRLMQGGTTTPPPLMAIQGWPCTAADAIAFCGVIENGGWGEATVGQAEEYFARLCFDCDMRIGEPAACRWFLNHWDDAPRTELFREVGEEVAVELLGREGVTSALVPEPFRGGGHTLDDSTFCGIVADYLDEHERPVEARMFRARMKILEGV